VPEPLRKPVVEYLNGAIFRGYIPSAPLNRWIALIWFVDGDLPSVRERVLPNGVVELILNLGDPHRVLPNERPDEYLQFRRAWIAGLQSKPLCIANEGNSHLIGIRFRPGGAYPFLGAPLGEVTNSVIEHEGRMAADVLEIREQVAGAADDTERLRYVEAVLMRRLLNCQRADGRVVRAIRLIGNEPPGTTIAQIASGLGISHKHLIDLFDREVGVGPKLLARILRFNKVVRSLDESHPPFWADVAHTYGYVDQAHLSNEFRALAGVTPTAYWRARTVDPNHIDLNRVEAR